MAPQPVIYIVDDDDAVRDSLCVLFGVEGLAARGHVSAQALLDDLPGVPHGCIVTDMHMAEMTGLELLCRLKALGVALPVIVMTGRGGPALAAEVMAAGAAAFIEKPFGPEDIIEAVRTAMRESGRVTG
ncbi:response regulator [Phenylobacterium sp.]|uniref:response regulator n=1 Tax=Phenylobacterium sp. TaxID=1871053 RepID=UPI00356244E5